MNDVHMGQRTPGVPRIPVLPGPRTPGGLATGRTPTSVATVPRIAAVATATKAVAPKAVPLAPPVPAGPQDVMGAIQELRHEVRGLKKVRSKYRRGLGVASVAVVASAVVAIAAITGSTTALVAIFGEGYSADENVFAITSQGALLNVLPVAAAGTSQGASIELAVSAGVATEALDAADWYYQVTLAEVSIAAIASHANYTVELYQNGTSLGTLYVKQNVFVDASVESVICRWDLGATLPAAAGYTVKVVSV